MVHFPKYYYRNEYLGNNRYKFYISDRKINDNYKEEGECLVGVFEAYVSATTPSMHSCYGVVSSAGQTISTFYTHAQSNGKKWGLIDYRAHKTIANMFCIMYGNTNISTANSSIPCSGGTKRYNYGKCGGTLALGNKDGKSQVNEDPGYYSSNFLGLEDSYYGKWEFVQGINIINRNWIVYDGGLSVDKSANQLISEGFTNVRLAGIGVELTGYITKIKHGEYADIVPLDVAGGSSIAYYADYYWQGIGNKALCRSGFSGNGDYCGVFVSAADNESSYSGSTIGSRLAFYGDIEVKTKDEWLALKPDFAG